jgi:hypothetical protein
MFFGVRRLDAAFVVAIDRVSAAMHLDSREIGVKPPHSKELTLAAAILAFLSVALLLQVLPNRGRAFPIH